MYNTNHGLLGYYNPELHKHQTVISHPIIRRTNNRYTIEQAINKTISARMVSAVPMFQEEEPQEPNNVYNDFPTGLEEIQQGEK